MHAIHMAYLIVAVVTAIVTELATLAVTHRTGLTAAMAAAMVWVAVAGMAVGWWLVDRIPVQACHRLAQPHTGRHAARRWAR